MPERGWMDIPSFVARLSFTRTAELRLRQGKSDLLVGRKPTIPPRLAPTVDQIVVEIGFNH